MQNCHYMESSDKECEKKYIQVGINQQSFHFIHIFVLKTYNNVTDSCSNPCRCEVSRQLIP